MGKYVQYGCGYSAPYNWINYDSSLSLRILKIPFIGKLVYKASGNRQIFPATVCYGDILNGLPEEEGSCDGVYASHVLEHLSRADCMIALNNTYSLLKPGGIFRIIVPDLEVRVRQYILDLENGIKDANDRFLRACYLGVESKPKSLIARLRKFYGASDHLWMYDYPSMTEMLKKAGFVDIRRCVFGDSADPMFKAVEDPDRFHYNVLNAQEVALDARRPVI
jgi:predicted SAM-dependent methyltransferase